MDIFTAQATVSCGEEEDSEKEQEMIGTKREMLTTLLRYFLKMDICIVLAITRCGEEEEWDLVLEMIGMNLEKLTM